MTERYAGRAIADAELQAAIWEGHYQHVSAALANGVDANSLAAYGDPMLVVAASRGHLKIVSLLLNYGADPDLATQNGPALLEAIRYGHSHVAEELLKHSAVFNWRYAEQAALYNRLSLLKNFLERGISANERGSNNDTLLISASFGGHTDAVKMLIDAGAEVNANNDNGWTALFAASANGKTEVVKMLLAAGADASAADNSGDTPLKAASLEGHQEIAALLKNAGATA